MKIEELEGHQVEEGSIRKEFPQKEKIMGSIVCCDELIPRDLKDVAQEKNQKN